MAMLEGKDGTVETTIDGRGLDERVRPTSFRDYLERHPAARTVLQERLSMYPEYRSFVEQFNPAMLTEVVRTDVR